MERLDEAKPYGPAPHVRPRDAATLILLRNSGASMDILMGRRSEKLAFMPGMFVFPGGRTERADLTAPRTGALHEADGRRLVSGMGARGSLRRAEALAMAAIRETQEETGLLIGRNSQAQGNTGHASWRPFAQSGILPDLAAIRYLARAITPPGRVRRFDTRFFVADADHVTNPSELIANPAEELEEVRWIAMADMEHVLMADITRTTLGILEDRLRADPDLSRDMPVPFMRVEHRRFVRTLE